MKPKKHGALPFNGTWTEENVPDGWKLSDEPCEYCHGSGRTSRVVPK